MSEHERGRKGGREGPRILSYSGPRKSRRWPMSELFEQIWHLSLTLEPLLGLDGTRGMRWTGVHRCTFAARLGSLVASCLSFLWSGISLLTLLNYNCSCQSVFT